MAEPVVIDGDQIDRLMPLIEAFTKAGDLVLDPFCGSNSALDAAQRLGRAPP